MPKGNKNATSAFDEILTTFSEEDDRKAFESLSERNPKLREFGMRQDEFSRRLNEVNDDLQELGKWREWRTNHWDSERSSTKAELAAQEKITALEQEKADLEGKLSVIGTGGDVANFEEIEQWLNGEISKRGFVTNDVLAKEKEQVNSLIVGTNKFFADAAMDVPYLNSKHQKEFGEMFDPKDFLKQATDKQRYDLREFYEKDYVVDKRQDKLRSDYESKLEAERKAKEEAITAAREEGRQSRDREVAMGVQGQTPTDMSGPQMGAFQQKYLGLKKDEEQSGAPDVPLGEDGISKFAARKFIESQANR